MSEHGVGRLMILFGCILDIGHSGVMSEQRYD
jgi:hypothetical protein